jgi:hypothetical protein
VTRHRIWIGNRIYRTLETHEYHWLLPGNGSQCHRFLGFHVPLLLSSLADACLTLALHDHNSWPLTPSHVWPPLPVSKLIQSPNWLTLYSLRMDLTESITFSSSSLVACAYLLPRRHVYQAIALQHPSHLVLLSVVIFLTVPLLSIG